MGLYHIHIITTRKGVFKINNTKLITPKQFYDIINSRVSGIIGKTKVYELVRRKDFPALKIGGRYYILENKIDEWFEKQSEKFWC